MAKINGTLMIFSADGSPIAHIQNVSLSVSRELPEATDFDSQGWAEHLDDAGIRSWTINVDGNADLAATGGNVAAVYDLINVDGNADLAATGGNVAAVYDLVVGRASVPIVFGPAGVSNINWTGNASFENVEVTAANETTVTFSGTAQGNGALTKSTGA